MAIYGAEIGPSGRPAQVRPIPCRWIFCSKRCCLRGMDSRGSELSGS